MRRPIAVLVPTLAFLLIAGTPFLRLEQGVPDATVYPAGVESRDAWVALQTEFRRRRDDADHHPGRRRRATRPTRPTITARACAFADAARGASTGIDRVEGPFTLSDPATGAPLTPDEVAALYAAAREPATRRASTRLREPYVRGGDRPARRDQPARPVRARPRTAVIPLVRAVADRRAASTIQVGGGAALG